MRDFLVDIVNHTSALGNISVVKITGDDQSTVIDTMADDKSIVVKGTFHNANPEFKGVFGMPNLSKLNTILNIPEYKENANIQLLTANRNGEIVPTGIHFENAGGDFKNDYRFMTTEVINERIKSAKFRGANWNVSFEPTMAGIQRFKFQMQANSDETVFIAKTENGDLKFYFGDHSTHAGDFVFQPGVTGTLSRGWSWPVVQFFSILNLDGDKTVNFSDDGAAMITVDSGLIKYEYILPAQSK